METTAEIVLFCNYYRSIKPHNEFIGFETKEALKYFCTCNNYYNRIAKKYMNTKKKQENEEKSQEIDSNNINFLIIFKVTFFTKNFQF